MGTPGDRSTRRPSGSLRQPPLVPEGAPATDALEAFKRFGLPLALVVDERGHIEGLITLAHVLEALVGEVPDEDEPAEEAIVRREDGSWLVDGLLAAEELKECLELEELPREEDDYQTVGGMVMDALRRVPAEGDCFKWEGYSFEVLDMDGRRVDKCSWRPPRRPTPRAELRRPLGRQLNRKTEIPHGLLRSRATAA